MKGSTAAVLAIGVIAAGYLFLKSRAQHAAAQQSFTSLGNVGGVTHSPDITTGGALSVLGKALPSLSTWFGGGSSSPAAVPSDQYSPGVGDPTLWNPVSATPSVLPYSYKQQNIDTPALLGTNDLFTPSADGSGSSGAYSDAGNDSVYGTDAAFA